MTIDLEDAVMENWRVIEHWKKTLHKGPEYTKMVEMYYPRRELRLSDHAIYFFISPCGKEHPYAYVSTHARYHLLLPCSHLPPLY
jgi:hypothetical protein